MMSPSPVPPCVDDQVRVASVPSASACRLIRNDPVSCLAAFSSELQYRLSVITGCDSETREPADQTTGKGADGWIGKARANSSA